MPAAENTVGATYRVLARKYRPTTFDQLIGQDAMVRTLTNAFASGRIAQAFMLTGVRGVGKTTTARIIARALNCVGPDGKGGPTAAPCGQCDNCTAIAEDRHVDVLELDAASRTGVGEMRELLDGVRYRPVSARYKVYIIDEVHMLSTSAFNALLKTLEEPPAHVKFVFATTEIRKVPVTVLSRCQRFDLRRIDADTLIKLYTDVAKAEGVEIAPAALALIARAADGSARDGLSLLDQAIARAEGAITEADVRDMLGLADRTQLFDLYDLLMRGDAKGALDLMGALYAAGADPAVVVQDLLELTHWLTRIKLVPQAAEAPGVPEAERVRGGAMAGKLTLAHLARVWQMLLKGLGEVQSAPLAAARRGDGDDPPHPCRRPADAGRSRAPAAGRRRRAGRSPAKSGRCRAIGAHDDGVRRGSDRAGAQRALGPTACVRHRRRRRGGADRTGRLAPNPESFVDIVTLLGERREAILQAHLRNNVHLVRFEPGRLEFRPDEHAPRNLANRLGALLSEWTGRRWVVAISGEPGEPTLTEQEVGDRSPRARGGDGPSARAGGVGGLPRRHHRGDPRSCDGRRAND